MCPSFPPRTPACYRTRGTLPVHRGPGFLTSPGGRPLLFPKMGVGGGLWQWLNENSKAMAYTGALELPLAISVCPRFLGVLLGR